MKRKKKNAPPVQSIPVIVEIPKGCRNKYEHDKKSNRIVFDRMLFSSVHYPSDYGYVPETLALDGDPLDALVLVWEPTFPGCLIESRPIGLFKMWDEKGEDDKILCVPVRDPLWNYIHDLSGIPPHLLKEIEHFFKIYKDLEMKKVKVDGWRNQASAVKCIREARERFTQRP
jgi:inorganic pyrophosphatase